MPDQPPASRKPQRSAASTALWAHLLRKDAIPDASNASTLPSNPPLVPFDKAGTSMRILLHDTQANFEKFSERADKLFGAVSETKRETITMQQLFQDDREKLVGQTVDLGELLLSYKIGCGIFREVIRYAYMPHKLLVIAALNCTLWNTIVNRCQTEIQKSLGTPAQSHKLDDLFNETHLTRVKMDALDKRVDSLQMVDILLFPFDLRCWNIPFLLAQSRPITSSSSDPRSTRPNDSSAFASSPPFTGRSTAHRRCEEHH